MKVAGERAREVTAAAGQPPARTARVVIADDDVRESRVLSWLLRERGYDVSVVGAGDAVVTALRERPADLVLLDANGHGEFLDETLRKLRAEENGRDIPVIVAGSRHSEEAAASFRSLADDWIPKPLRLTELLTRVGVQLRARGEVRAMREKLARKHEELERALDDVETTRQLVEILNEVTTDLTESEIYRVLARRVARALDLSHCSIVLASEQEPTGTVVAAYDDPSITNLEIRIDRYPELAAALRTGRPVLVTDVMNEPLFAQVREIWKQEGRSVPVKSVLALPFSLDRKRGGVFFLRTERGERQLRAEDAEFGETVIKAAVAAIRRAQALESTRADNRRLEELATTDSLTRLMNRRALLERLNAEVDRARRFKSQLSLLMLDLDHFKGVNDRHGHLVGDTVLRQTGAVLSGAVRTIDVVARYGGEEFVLILPETALEGAVTFAERMRERLHEFAFEIDADRRIHLTCSVGVATFPSQFVLSTEDLFARADEALYRAKTGGRNQVRT
jgi:two-component system, cell cycle response regulator